MDMRVDTARREDLAFTRDNLRTGSDDDRNAGLRIRISGLSDHRDTPVAKPHIGLVDAGMIEDQSIGNDCIHRG